MCLLIRFYVFTIRFIEIRYKIIFIDKIMQPPFYWWHYFGTICIYMCFLCADTLLCLSFPTCMVWDSFFLASLQPYLHYDKVRFYFRFDKVLIRFLCNPYLMFNLVMFIGIFL